MTELQTKELELLKVFINICDILNLKYFLVCGTALGTVKYQGFIPWDDDVDVGLLREDYEIFLEKAPKLLPEGMFLQNYKSDPAFPQIYSKLRNSNTTYIEKSVAHIDMNHGIYIDIFPLDGYPQDIDEQKKLEKKKAIFQKKLSCVFDLPRNGRAMIGYFIRRGLKYHKKTSVILDKYTKLISKHSTDETKVLCNHGNYQGKLEYAAREQYGNGVEATFEGLKVRIPEKYDDYLTQKYGDWRNELPEEQKYGHHFYTICDTEKPYTLYIK